MKKFLSIFVVICSSYLVGCASVPSFLQEPTSAPVVRSFSDGKYWMLAAPLRYKNTSIPQGFVTDFASVPTLFWSFGISPTGPYGKAAIVHDYLYWTQVCTKEQSDRVFYDLMLESKVDPLKAKLIYEAVKLGGGSAWAENKAAKANGFIKQVPYSYISSNLQNFSDKTTWLSLQADMHAKKLKEDKPTINSGDCVYGIVAK